MYGTRSVMGAFAGLVVQEALVAFEVLLFEFGEAGGGSGFGLAPFGTGALDFIITQCTGRE